ncbi:hypothetical protein [Methanoculleus taiwanensis]|nr:hypothetical protein [Methanoculleus taiwanensis]
MADGTSRNQKEGIAEKIKKLFTPENDCGCCCNVKIVPKETDKKKE